MPPHAYSLAINWLQCQAICTQSLTMSLKTHSRFLVTGIRVEATWDYLGEDQGELREAPQL